MYPRFQPGGDYISNMGPKPILYFLASPEPAQCRGCQHLGARWNPAAYSELDEDAENEEVFIDNNSIGLTWGDVARAASVGETRPRRNSLN